MNEDDGDADSAEEGEEASPTKAIVDEAIAKLKRKFMKRITRLEDIVSRQEVELYRLKQQAAELMEVSEAFTNLIQLLREAGLDADTLPSKQKSSSEDAGVDATAPPTPSADSKDPASPSKFVESYDEEIIFGTAPSSV
ncbi:MAG: hypothetical protein SGARI_004741, partial [Bacillariaceae sp.]